MKKQLLSAKRDGFPEYLFQQYPDLFLPFFILFINRCKLRLLNEVTCLK